MAKRRAQGNMKGGGRKAANGWALLLIDVINELEFPGAEKLLPKAVPMARRVAALKRRAERAGVPCVYVNDNFGQWRSDFQRLVERVLEGGARGEPVGRLLAPADDDYFVLKPLHSGFYSTALDTLLRELGCRKLVICGMATDSCVLFTAADAYIRGFEIVVPSDGCASESGARHRGALAVMKKMLKARTPRCAGISFS